MSAFIGLRSDDDAIGRMEVQVVIFDAAGAERPVEFGVNSIEFLTPVGNGARSSVNKRSSFFPGKPDSRTTWHGTVSVRSAAGSPKLAHARRR